MDMEISLDDIRITRVTCFCSGTIRFSKREYGTCHSCGAFIAITRKNHKIGMIWAYGEGKRLIHQPVIIDWEVKK